MMFFHFISLLISAEIRIRVIEKDASSSVSKIMRVDRYLFDIIQSIICIVIPDNS
jgi:hypothetical protein